MVATSVLVQSIKEALSADTKITTAHVTAAAKGASNVPHKAVYRLVASEGSVFWIPTGWTVVRRVTAHQVVAVRRSAVPSSCVMGALGELNMLVKVMHSDPLEKAGKDHQTNIQFIEESIAALEAHRATHLTAAGATTAPGVSAAASTAASSCVSSPPAQDSLAAVAPKTAAVPAVPPKTPAVAAVAPKTADVAAVAPKTAGVAAVAQKTAAVTAVAPKTAAVAPKPVAVKAAAGPPALALAKEPAASPAKPTKKLAGPPAPTSPPQVASNSPKAKACATKASPPKASPPKATPPKATPPKPLDA